MSSLGPDLSLALKRRGRAGAAGSTLLSGLLDYWALSDLTSVNSHSLTNVNAATFVTGKLGNCTQLVRASVQHLDLTPFTGLRPGNSSLTVQAWAWADSDASFRIITGIWGGVGNQKEWCLRRDAGGLAFTVSNDGAAEVVVNNGAAPTVGTWYHLLGWHDAAADTVNLRVNGGTVVSAAHAAGIFTGTDLFRVGARNADGDLWDGKVDAVGVWSRVLTTTEQDALYNSGAGREYPW